MADPCQLSSAELKAHPAAEIFPAMTGSRFDALVADIREHGLLEPIILTDGLILDGRNRYRACREIDVDAVVEEWNGEGTPESYVVSKNLHRRHLNESQRAMIAAKLANRELGSNQFSNEDRSIDLPTAAAMLNVSEPSVKRARVVLNKGTPEEIGAVENGVAAVSAVAKNIKKCEKETADATPPQTNKDSLHSGARIAVPEGMTPEQACRMAMGLEDEGLDAATAAKKIGLGVLSYRKLRDVVALSDRTDLSKKDHTIVRRVLADINERMQIQQPYRKVVHLIDLIWGPSKSRGNRREQNETRRIEDFDRAYFVLIQSCASAEKITVPHLSPARLEEIARELEAAEAHIQRFRDNIMETNS